MMNEDAILYHGATVIVRELRKKLWMHLLERNSNIKCVSIIKK